MTSTHAQRPEASRPKKKRTHWTSAMDKVLRDLYSTTTAQRISEQLGCHLTTVKKRIKRLKLRKRHPTTPRNHQDTQSFAPWTSADEQLLRDKYLTTPTRALAKHLKRSVNAIHVRARVLDLPRKKTARPIGAERVNSKGLRLRKISDTGNQHRDYKRVDLIEWEQKHGPLPPGMILVISNPFLPRTPENLIPLTAKQLTARISGQEICPDLKELFLLQRQLTKALKPASVKPKQHCESSF